MYQRILVPLDGLAHAEAVMPWAKSLSIAFSTEKSWKARTRFIAITDRVECKGEKPPFGKAKSQTQGKFGDRRRDPSR